MVKVLNLHLGVVGSFYLFSEDFFFKFVCFMMAEYARTTAQTRIFEIFFYKIIDWKLDGNNYLK